MTVRILLINPPYPFEEGPTPPLGLTSLGAYIEEKGYEVRIQDYLVNPYSLENARQVIEAYKPQVIGATGVTMNIKKSLAIVEDYKRINPDLVAVMGGPHVSFDAHNILTSHPAVDFIVRGEGEITFHELLTAITNKGTFDHIPGLSYRKDGAVVHNDIRPFIQDINILPKPDRSLLELSKYRALGIPASMITSRGCPHQCIFCVGSQMVGRKVRYFSVERVLEEFEMLTALGVKQINIVDDLFTSHKKRCMEICEEIVRRGIVHRWSAFARVDTVSIELLHAMKSAGCVDVCFGFESGNQEILDRVKKKTNLEAARKAMDLCREAGLKPLASYILGLPGETPETVEKTMEFANSLGVDYGFHILAPFPGSEVREKSGEYNLRILTDDWDLYDANHAVSESAVMSHQEIDRIFLEFNSRSRDKFIKQITMYDEGKTVPEESVPMIKGFKDFLFVHTLINEDLVTSYPGMKGGDDDTLYNDFSDFIARNTNIKKDVAAANLKRLIAVKCLKVSKSSDTARLSWV